MEETNYTNQLKAGLSDELISEIQLIRQQPASGF